ncbi:hypothetical protein [Alterinioella nitratireducens]|uniref:hypothetical protein n=1 Tax=Alterinioella nitratireducens TaxID=2735915 RepID=UPI001555D7EF|nr:hypothetical protein [Alterinioella nitratireducens]NPD18481.1 hypothetical protein [Alterinioella nitratireducens]
MIENTHPQGWQGLLAPGETILWQGQPGTGIRWRSLASPLTLMGAFFTGFSLFWISMATSMTRGADVPFPFQIFPLFGLPFLAIGLYMLGGHAIWDTIKRAGTHYTLTNRTAFVGVNLLMRRTLLSYPIDRMDRVLLEDGIPGSVIFSGVQGRGATRPGFYLIDDAREVYRMLRDARSALTQGNTA